jgi:putative spermidine/putrescine transport system substrate-binding protein
LKERYGITLNRVPLADTADAVNQVLSEKQAGKDPGAVDLIWINGENFFTLKQADMLYKDWAQKLPNSQYVNWENPAIHLDFGTPVDNMESPWSSAQFQFIYDSARTGAGELPHSYGELKDWACAYRFTYFPGPSGFLGTICQALYEISGGGTGRNSIRRFGINGRLSCGNISANLNPAYGATVKRIRRMNQNSSISSPITKWI